MGRGAWVLVGPAAVPSPERWDRLGLRRSRPGPLLPALAIQTFGIALPALPGGTAAALVSALLFGATFIGVSTLALAIGADLRFPRSVARLTTGWSVGQMLGPWPQHHSCAMTAGRRWSWPSSWSSRPPRPPPCCASASRTTWWWWDLPHRYDDPLRQTARRPVADDASDMESDMTTARDLLITALNVASDRPVEQGDLSLALAGAELIDLVEARAVTLDGDRVVPGAPLDMADRLLDDAVSSLSRQEPYESVEDWLWRRGRGLSAAYVSALEAKGELTRRRRSWFPLRSDRTAPADSPELHHATERLASGDPVLVGLAAAVGTHDEPTENLEGLTDDAIVTVLAAVNDAVTELTAVRQRREIEDAAFDNIWRAP